MVSVCDNLATRYFVVEYNDGQSRICERCAAHVEEFPVTALTLEIESSDIPVYEVMCG
jgi:hypothetical protein